MRTGLIVGGVVVVILGFIFTGTIIGAIIGLPFILIGFIMIIWGLVTSGKRTEQVIVSQPPTRTETVRTEIVQKIMVRCPNCSTLNPEDATYCSKCGAELKK